MAQEIGFAAPRAEEMTKVVAGIGGAGITGVAEGVIVKMAPQLGAAAPVLEWGTLLGIPLLGVGGALFTRGLLGDIFQGMAAGGVAVLGYTLPELLIPAAAGKRALGQGNPGSIKQLGSGQGSALQRSQAGARVGLEF